MKRSIRAVAITLTIAASVHTAAYAGTVASIGLVDDGHLDLSDVAFPSSGTDLDAEVRQTCKGQRIAKAWGNSDDRYGCWSGDGEGHVIVNWTNGYIVLGSHTYRIDNSMVTAYGRQHGWSVR
jgi:hypothetical protein